VEAHPPGSRPRTGLILGKFLPPHRGHLYAVEFGCWNVEELTVLVCSIAREPIPGKLRYEWMRELCPGCRVVHLDEELPQTPEEDPEFWPKWVAAIRRSLPEGPDLVFASEPYGSKLAESLGARFVPVDLERKVVPISGTAIRQTPMRNWEFIPPPVRPWFAKRVCVFGPESTGKSTLAEDLARDFQTAWVPEFARTLLDPKGGRCDPSDIPLIARGQVAAEDAAAREANRVLLCDTDTLTTTIWSRVLFGECPGWIDELAASRRYDLTLLCDIDVPWVDDAQRYLPGRREEFFDLCREALDRGGRRYVVIRGDWEERRRFARAAIQDLVVD
jgi:HTH-type transcriptional repressor of NAD biosynthesis genes